MVASETEIVETCGAIVKTRKTPFDKTFFIQYRFCHFHNCFQGS